MITYGNGEVLIDDLGKAFEIIYKGSLQILDSPDDLFITANNYKIVGIMLNGQNMPNKIFSYRGNFQILNCKIADNNKYIHQKVKTQGIDFWNIDTQVWESDDSLWDNNDNDYTYGTIPKINQHNIVVNNNIRTQFDGQYVYKNGDIVPKNTLIHIHGDLVVMTGGTHQEDSVEIYKSKQNINEINKIARQVIQSTARYSAPSVGSSSSVTSGGGY